MQGLGLCHGISGNAYALLAAHRLTGDARRLQQATQLGAFMSQHWQQLLGVPDRPLSLFEVRLPLGLLAMHNTPRFVMLRQDRGTDVLVLHFRAWLVQCASGLTLRTLPMRASLATSSEAMRCYPAI
jgi:hypothetical protein